MRVCQGSWQPSAPRLHAPTLMSVCPPPPRPARSSQGIETNCLPPPLPLFPPFSHTDKGIKTNYLPGNTVALKAVDVPHDVPQDGNIGGKYKKEYNYNFM